MFSSEIVTSYLYVRLLRNMNSIICYLLNIASSVFCYMFASSLFFFSFYIFLLHIYMVELHFKFLLNFSVSCCFSVEAGSSGSLFVQSWIFFFSFRHAHVFLFQLGSFIYVPADTCFFSAFTHFLYSYKSFMLLTFWSFLRQRKTSLAKSPLNYGPVQKSKLHLAVPYS